MKRTASGAIVAVEPAEKPTEKVFFQWPLALYLSPRIPAEQAAVLAARVASEAKGLCIADLEDGALHVLPSFELEELAALQRRRRRVVGLPFVERLLKDRTVLDKVQALPLFDLIYRSEKGFCFSAMTEEDRTRYQALATWVGVRVAQDVGSDTELLVARKVSLRPDSKYQKALALRLPIVRPSYLEALWDEKQLVDKEGHFLQPLAGLAINFGPIQDQVSPELQKRAEASGAVITTLDKAEVVIVADTSRPMYKEGRALGLLVAPPLWLERCLQIRCCLEISGDLEVPQAGVPAGMSPLSVEEANIKMWFLLDCTLCLLYLEPGRPREEAIHMAMRCGAWTTLNPSAPSVTHVLFDVEHGVKNVSVRADEDVSFVDVRWLVDCVSAGKRISETPYVRTRVHYNPALDTAYASLFLQDSGVIKEEGLAALDDAPRKNGAQLVEVKTEETKDAKEKAAPLAGLTIRITALDDSRHSSRHRQQLQGMIQNLGAKVADSKSRLADITHIVCVTPDRLEAGLAEKAKKRQIHLVTVQWLQDCNRHGNRQPEARYTFRDGAPPPAAIEPLLDEEETVGKASSGLAATVLASCDVCVSPRALGAEARLLQMAKELGANPVRAWRNVGELKAFLQAPVEGQRVVIVEKDEAKQGLLESCVEKWTPELRSIFVQPSWLCETSLQRRRLPLSSFAAFSGDEEVGSAPRVAPEAAYAWQPAEMKQLEEMSAQARAREVESKAQQKLTQGLRLANLGS